MTTEGPYPMDVLGINHTENFYGISQASLETSLIVP